MNLYLDRDPVAVWNSASLVGAGLWIVPRMRPSDTVPERKRHCRPRIFCADRGVMWSGSAAIRRPHPLYLLGAPSTVIGVVTFRATSLKEELSPELARHGVEMKERRPRSVNRMARRYVTTLEAEVSFTRGGWSRAASWKTAVLAGISHLSKLNPAVGAVAAFLSVAGPIAWISATRGWNRASCRRWREAIR